MHAKERTQKPEKQFERLPNCLCPAFEEARILPFPFDHVHKKKKKAFPSLIYFPLASPFSGIHAGPSGNFGFPKFSSRSSIIFNAFRLRR